MEPTVPQRILVLQQEGRGESKTEGIRRHGGDRFRIRTVTVPGSLPGVLDDTGAYLPAELDADLVLDFLEHPDLSHDLARACLDQGVPLIASGRKVKIEGVHTPPT
jgi:hypothetical protein